MNNQQTPLGIYLTKICVFMPFAWWAILIDRREYGDETERARRGVRLL